AYAPTLRFQDGERHFPIRAESWLAHGTSADWPETAGRHGDDLEVDDGRHGTALVRADADVVALTPLAGTPLFDSPMLLEPAAIGANALATHLDPGPDVFLDFGGWGDPQRRTGNEGYLDRTFSELAAAMAPSLTWNPVEIDPLVGRTVPAMWIPQPVTPTVYAEFEWTGIFPSWAAQLGLTDFAPEADGGRLRELDGFLSLTYYYLYAFRRPADDGSPARLEGQWEAVSLLFGGKTIGARPDGRPESMEIVEPPQWVVVSQGLVGGTHRVRAATWDEVTKLQIPDGGTLVDSTSCLLYVGRGTHVFHFGPEDGDDWDEPPPGSGLDLDLSEGNGWRWLMALIYLLLLALVILFIIFAAGIILAIILGLVALVLLILFVLSLFGLFGSDGTDVKPHPQNEEATGNGPQAGGEQETPAGDPIAPGATVPPGTPNAGSPTGRDIAAFDVRVVDVFNHPDELTGFPAAEPCEHPTWWAYTGGWGVRVPTRLSSAWTDGMRRVDDQRRSWAYFAAAEVARRIDA
ncbi:MAG: hypothetical protein ACREQ9_14980, partial [Candidatus Binatia bacterium]